MIGGYPTFFLAIGLGVGGFLASLRVLRMIQTKQHIYFTIVGLTTGGLIGQTLFGDNSYNAEYYSPIEYRYLRQKWGYLAYGLQIKTEEEIQNLS